VQQVAVVATTASAAKLSFVTYKLKLTVAALNKRLHKGFVVAFYAAMIIRNGGGADN